MSSLIYRHDLSLFCAVLINVTTVCYVETHQGFDVDGVGEGCVSIPQSLEKDVVCVLAGVEVVPVQMTVGGLADTLMKIGPVRISRHWQPTLVLRS